MKKQGIKINHEFLKHELDRSDFKLEKIAEKVGISKATLQMYAWGSRPPSRPVVKLLAQVLNCKEEDFYKSSEAS